MVVTWRDSTIARSQSLDRGATESEATAKSTTPIRQHSACSEGCVESKHDSEGQYETPVHNQRLARSEPRALNGATHVWRAAAAKEAALV